MQLTEKQKELIAGLPIQYAFRSSTEAQVQKLVPLAYEIIRLCLESGLETKHLIAFMHLFNSSKMKQKTLKSYITMCVPKEQVPVYLDKFLSIQKECYLTPPLDRQRIDLAPETLDLIKELLAYVAEGDIHIGSMKKLLDKYEESQTTQFFDMKSISFLLYFLQPEICPIFNYLDDDGKYLQENFGYDGKYSTYLEIFNAISSHSQEKNMLHLAWMINLRGGFNPGDRVAAAAGSLADLVFE